MTTGHRTGGRRTCALLRGGLLSEGSELFPERSDAGHLEIPPPLESLCAAGPFEFQIDGTASPVPEPDTLLLLLNLTWFSRFFSTAKISSVALLDENGNPVSNPLLLAESGTIYPLAGELSSVPEPSTARLMGTAVALLSITRLN